MRYIANIVTSSKKYKFNDFIKICNNIDDIQTGLPTLVVGVDNAKKMASENLNYVIRDLGDNIFWTFGITEKRSENEKDVIKFKKDILKHLKKTIQYDFFNILTCSKSKIKNFIKFLDNDVQKNFFLTHSMVYISYEDRVIGVSLDDCEYIGIHKKKIYKKIKNRFRNVICFDSFLTDDEKTFFNNDNILLAAMFCYANS